MRSAHTKFYKGLFYSQFIIEKRAQQGAYKMGEIELLPRFLLRDLIEINASEFDEAVRNRLSMDAIKYQERFTTNENASHFILEPHIFRQQRNLMEWEKADKQLESIIVDQYLLLLPSNQAESNYAHFDFIAEKDGITHGRLHGTIFCEVYDPPVSEKKDLVESLHLEEQKKSRKDKFGIMEPIVPNSGCNPISWMHAPNPALGCLPGGCAAGGCLGFGLPGCFGAGCFRIGCGLIIPLLLLLALLGWGWRSCNQSSDSANRNKSGKAEKDAKLNASKKIVIHDTVYVKEGNQIKELVDSTIIHNADAILLPNVQFYTNSAKLLPYSIRPIQELADYMMGHPAVNAIIKGHTDDVGDPMTNMKLSQERAETVRQVLVSFGVDAARIQARGYGSSQPKTRDKTVEGRAINRRVEVELLNMHTTETHRIEH